MFQKTTEIKEERGMKEVRIKAGPELSKGDGKEEGIETSSFIGELIRINETAYAVQKPNK